MSIGIYAVAIPKWGIEMENGTITCWHSKLGDSVTLGEELVDIESDKIMNTLEATATGVLRRVFLEADATLGVGELIGIIAEEGVSDEAIDAFVESFNAALQKDAAADNDAKPEMATSSQSAAAPTSSAAVTTAAAAPAAVPASGKVRVSPPVRRRAEKLGIDLATVVGTGAGGRITSDDVERAASEQADSQGSDTAAGGGEQSAAAGEQSAAASEQKVTTRKLSSTEQTIGRRLVESKQSVPHFYLSIDIALDGLIAKRKTLNAEQAQRVSINDLIVWCTARALVSVPEINAQLVDDEVRQFEHVDISVAVATDRGLLTPIIRAAEQLSPVEVSTGIAQLIDKAKNGGLERNDIVGGSFTVSNLGMFGVKSFDAIINPPQVAILALGKAQKQLVVGADDETSVATIVTANLSSDHRVVDGALGGKFLTALKREIEALS